MTTQFVGLKEFRQNLATYTTKVASQKTRLIILKKNRPVLDVRGLDEEAMFLEKLAQDVAKARDDVKKGRVHSQKKILREFGLA